MRYMMVENNWRSADIYSETCNTHMQVSSRRKAFRRKALYALARAGWMA